MNPLFRNTSSVDALGAVTSTNFDVFGNVTSVVDPLNNTTSYTYNKLQQLVTENKGTDRSFSYDANGNLATLTDRNTRHSFDSAGRLKSITHSKTELGAGVNWDGTSSLPSTGTFAAYFLNYDADNRITSLASRADGFVTKYTYDAFDQRTAKRVDSDGNGTWDRYEVYTWADSQEVQRWVDTDGAGTGQKLRLANRYLWAESVDQLLSDEQYASGTGMEIDATTASGTAGTTLWALTDHLGSVRDLLDNNGVVREHNVFDSFGRLIREVDYNSSGTAISSTDAAAVDSIFGYTGRDWDSDIGMQYNRARWYDPQTGRWLSQDPIGFAAGDANLYRYVGNGPTNATDSSGLEGYFEGIWQFGGNFVSEYANSFSSSDNFFSGVGNAMIGIAEALDPRTIPADLAQGWELLDDDLQVAQQMIYSPGEYWNGRKKAAGELTSAIQQKCSTNAGIGEVYVQVAGVVIAKKISSVQILKGGGKIGSIPTGPESAVVRQLYLEQVNSRTFAYKLKLHNAIKKLQTLGRSENVTVAQVECELLANTEFRIGASSLHKIGDGYIVGGRESLGYFNRSTSHHEMLHIGQYIRNPNLIDTRPFGYVHEIVPSFVGTPELYGGGVVVIGGTVIVGGKIINK
ncbi:RHS repeat domain-containing protein [Pirellulaceae bacterium SH467]